MSAYFQRMECNHSRDQVARTKKGVKTVQASLKKLKEQAQKEIASLGCYKKKAKANLQNYYGLIDKTVVAIPIQAIRFLSPHDSITSLSLSFCFCF